jgi:acetyl esterase
MSLDPDNQQVLDMMKAAGRPPVNELQPEEARKMYRASRGALQPELPEMAEVRDHSAPGPAGDIPLRVYRGMGTKPGPLPVLVFYHGGGYVIGDLDTHDYYPGTDMSMSQPSYKRDFTQFPLPACRPAPGGEL